MDNDAKEKKRQYLKAWRKRNPQKVKAYNINYWKRRALRELNASRKDLHIEIQEAANENK